MMAEPPGQPDPGKLLKLGLSDTNLAAPFKSECTAWKPPKLETINKEIEGYEILDFIGRGGMAAVYRAKDADGQSVAIKILPQDLSSNPDANGLTVSPFTYRVPEGIILRESSQASGLRYFGGRALLLESGSILEIDGGMGFFGFAELHLNGGEIHYGKRYSELARELIGGTIIVNAKTKFQFPNWSDLQEKDFILQGKLKGDGSIHVYGGSEEYLYLNADTSEYDGIFHVEQGTLAPMNRDSLQTSEVVLEKGGCYLRCYCPGPATVAKLTMSSNSWIELRDCFLHIEELTIEGDKIPDGHYPYDAPELKGVVRSSKNGITVGSSRNS